MKILLTSHGLFAEGILDSLKMLIGEVSDIDVITFSKTMGIDELKEILESYIYDNNGNELLVFTDLKGGTPFNVISLLSHESNNIKVFYGMNLPVIVEAATMKEILNLNELIEHIENNIDNSIGFSEL